MLVASSSAPSRPPEGTVPSPHLPALRRHIVSRSAVAFAPLATEAPVRQAERGPSPPPEAGAGPSTTVLDARCCNCARYMARDGQPASGLASAASSQICRFLPEDAAKQARPPPPTWTAPAGIAPEHIRSLTRPRLTGTRLLTTSTGLISTPSCLSSRTHDVSYRHKGSTKPTTESGVFPSSALTFTCAFPPVS
jgi:hypothetical protein